MPTTRDYQVSFNKATQKTNGLITITFNLTDRTPPSRFSASSLEEVIAHVEELAKHQTTGCKAYVKCLATRKPPGFDARTRDLYYHLEAAPAQTHPQTATT